ncbi:trypsin-like serine protease [Desulfobacterales bacterium HSG2]|nr:trypsin-like serine protease [Desulfobacterales bacterium HSG2]
MKFYKAGFYVAVCFIILATGSVHAGSDEGADPFLSQRISPRIVGGYEAEPGAWPWMVALADKNSSSLYSAHFCGGSLIHRRWVVTAAHCVEDEKKDNFDVVLNAHDLKNDTGERIGVKRIIVHPTYDPRKYDWDIALLELEEDASNEPIPLTAEGDLLEGKEAVTLGWGNTEQWSYESSEILLQVSVPIVSNDLCREAYSDDEITDSMICAGYIEGGKDACYGDSGGPLIVQEGDIWRLTGIVSWGEGCAKPGYYGVYARISQLLGFINEYVSILEISVPETATEGDGILRGIVSVQETSDAPLVVSLSSGNIQGAVVPDTVTIPAGESSAAFDITISDDSLLDGTQTVVITAQAFGQSDAAGVIQVNDNETAVLTLRIPEDAVEGRGVLSGQGTVTVNTAPSRDVTVSLISDDTGEVTVPAKATIPAGQTTAAFDITIIYDGITDDTQTVNITASVPGWTSGSAAIDVIHYEIDFFTEEFKGNNDLAYQTLTFTSDGSGNFYSVCREEASAFPTDPAGGTVLSLWDDDYDRVSLSEAQVSLYGVSYSSFYVGSDGDISFGSGNNEKDRTLDFHFKGPRISGLLIDLNPEGTEGISWKQSEDRAVVTYQDIPEFDISGTSNSFQIEMFFNGVIRITYLNISAKDGVAGLSGGGGIPAGFKKSDLSGYGFCGPLLFLSIPEAVAEGDGILIGQGKVSVEVAPANNLSVNLISGDTSKIIVVDTVLISAGKTSSVFDLTITDDAIYKRTETITISASAEGYASGSDTIRVVNRNIPGDVDYSGAADLRDAILALKVMAGMDVGYVYSGANVDGDGKIGMAEVLFILRAESGGVETIKD